MTPTPKLFRCYFCGAFARIDQMRQNPYCQKCGARLQMAVSAGLWPVRARPDYRLSFWQTIRLIWRRRLNRRRYAKKPAQMAGARD